jgi:hypothetical protein
MAPLCLTPGNPGRGRLYSGLERVGCHGGCLGTLIDIVLLLSLVPSHVVPGQKIALDNPFGVKVVGSEVVLE